MRDFEQMGPGFCLAKFYDLTLHLNSGHNHSCIHPQTHQVPLAELSTTEHALHNSAYKKSVRQQMLNGQRPTECGYCWRMEDSGTQAQSDRIGFSYNLLNQHPELLSEVQQYGADHNYHPRQLEVSFSSTCNFKCVYCSPELSSKWLDDVVKHGAIDLGSGAVHSTETMKQRQRFPISVREHNPWVDAFWSWFPQVYSKLTFLKVTGGEPLLHSDTFRLLDWILDQPNHNLKLGINSNLGVPDRIIDNLIEKLQQLSEKKSTRTLTVWTSGEAVGSQFDYIRQGGTYQQWQQNIKRLLSSVSDVNVKIMTTYSILSVAGYQRFLSDMLEIYYQYPTRFSIDTHQYLQYPKYLRMDMLTEDFVPCVEQQVETVADLCQQGILPGYQLDNAQRVLTLLNNALADPQGVQELRQQFCRYVDEFDRRNGTDFVATFPELENFYRQFKRD